MVKEFLSREGIAFEEINVSENRAGLRALVALGRNSTPVVVDGDTVIVGYKPKELKALAASQTGQTLTTKDT